MYTFTGSLATTYELTLITLQVFMDHSSDHQYQDVKIMDKKGKINSNIGEKRNVEITRQ